MSSTHGEINHLSDTFLMAAACRAFETESEDGFVRDPFASRLAGERGLRDTESVRAGVICGGQNGLIT